MPRLPDAECFRGTPIAEDDPLHWYHAPVIGRFYRRRIDVALRLVGTGKRVLELAFGSGVTFLDLSRQYEEIWGIDRHPYCGSIRDIYGKEGVRLRLARASVLDPPFASGSFDGVLAISILEHLKPHDQPRVMEAIHRMLRPGGVFVIGVPGFNVFMNSAFWMMGYNIHEHHFSNPRVVREAAAARFTLEEVIRQPPFVPDWLLTYTWMRCRKA